MRRLAHRKLPNCSQKILVILVGPSTPHIGVAVWVVKEVIDCLSYVTVGALEEGRYITNEVTDINSNMYEAWFPMTDDSNAVWNTSPFGNASADGNVGIGTEGTYGRFKPDVVAPGTFVVSCRSEQWDTNAYYNPTNNDIHVYSELIPSNSVSVSPFQFYVPSNAVEVIFAIATNAS